jgi:ATP phosphoribosyltransferase
VRGRDIPRLLAEKHIDAAIGSCLLFEEYDSSEVFQAAALNIASCRLSLITLNEGSEKNWRSIGTRYPHLTKKLLKNIRPLPSLIELSGCVESALFLGMCDAITDIVETGWTLDRLSLHEREVLATFGHGIWVRLQDRHSYISKLEELMPSVDWKSSNRLIGNQCLGRFGE